MSNDLISRSAFKELLVSYGCLDAAALLEDIPTTYDVDKVVEQLEKEGNNIFETHFPKESFEFYNNGIARGLWKAEKIVKAGGVNE